MDILERLNVLFSPNGYIVNSTIDGCIQMKSYLSGNPELKLALNSDLVIGKGWYGGSQAVPPQAHQGAMEEEACMYVCMYVCRVRAGLGRSSPVSTHSHRGDGC